MAYTVTELGKTVFGNQRVRQVLVSADAVSGNVNGGFKNIIAVAYAPQSMNSGGIKIKKNTTTANSALAGSVNLSDLTSGDDLVLTIYGT